MASKALIRSSDAHAAYIAAQNKYLPGSGSFDSPTEALLAYLGAFESKDAGFIEKATTSGSLIEIPTRGQDKSCSKSCVKGERIGNSTLLDGLG
ncbi:hypothetical protein MESS4_p20106 [Mesorhizobium sp. STM 4661]|nr:hypothetical protein MESS4_p20106 [Mesorhizobium sp. STM 4661]